MPQRSQGGHRRTREQDGVLYTAAKACKRMYRTLWTACAPHEPAA